MSQTQAIRNKQGGFNLFSIATVVMMLFYILPQAVLIVRNDVMAIIVTVYYALFIRRYVSPATVLKTLLLAIPYLLLFWANGFPGNARLGFVLPFMTLWTLVMPCFAIIAVVKRNNPDEQKVIIIAISICLLYVFISTFRGLAIDPLIMREMAGSEDIAVHIARMKSVGGYGFAYAVGALFIASWLINKFIKHSLYLKLLMIVIIIACGVLIVQSQYATLLFISIFGVAIYYFITANTLGKKIRVVVIALIAFFASQTLVIMGTSLFGGDVLRYKFTLIYDAIWGNAGVENISGDRLQLQLDAFDLFLSSPIWGYSGATNLEEFNESHSTFIGNMALTGIIGVTSFFLLFYSSIKHMISIVFANITEKKLYIPILFFYFLFAWLNPIEYAFECAWMIFFVVPLMFEFLINKYRLNI